MTGHYDPSGVQAEFEPGARGRVLRNLLGIKRVGDINEAESQALLLAQATELYGDDQEFAVKDVCDLHRLWLGPIYPSAGEYRTVNMGKNGFQFAHAPLIQGLMVESSTSAAFTPRWRETTCLCAQYFRPWFADLEATRSFQCAVNARASVIFEVLVARSNGWRIPSMPDDVQAKTIRAASARVLWCRNLLDRDSFKVQFLAAEPKTTKPGKFP